VTIFLASYLYNPTNFKLIQYHVYSNWPTLSNDHTSVSCEILANKPLIGPLVGGSRRCIFLELLLPVRGVPVNHKVTHFILVFEELAGLTWLINDLPLCGG
jgi:hypothetical protein